MADCELKCVCGCGEFMYCWRIVNWTLCVVAVNLCIAGGLWTELCVWLRWDYVLWRIVNWTLFEVAVNLCITGGLGTELCVCVSVEFMYCWRIVNWTLCVFAVRLSISGGLWTGICVWFQWDYILLADWKLNCVSVWNKFIYCGRILNWTEFLVAVSFCIPDGLWT